jgi:hypothetical protein
MSKTNIDLSKYMGVHAKCRDAQHAAVLLENSTISRSVYREGTVDHVSFDEAVILHDETVEAIYSQFTPLEQPYTSGTRVFLEKIVDKVTAGLSGEREKAIALMDWVRDIPIIYGRSGRSFSEGGSEAFHGGTEEEVIRKGSTMCNETARVLCILSQIAGIPSRYIGHMTLINYDDPRSGTGHGVCELYIEGAWAYFDIRGRYFLKSDGKIASAWDLVQDPSLVEKQSEEVRSHMFSKMGHEHVGRFYHASSVHVVVNYLTADHAKYDYSWVYPSDVLIREAREKGRSLRITKHADILPQPKARVV